MVSGQGGQRLGPTLPGAPEPAPLCPCWGLRVSGDLCHPQLDVADLQKELDKSQSMFPENPSVWVKDLAGYLNYKLQAPKSDPALSQHAHGQWHPPAALVAPRGLGGWLGGTTCPVLLLVLQEPPGLPLCSLCVVRALKEYRLKDSWHQRQVLEASGWIG